MDYKQNLVNRKSCHCRVDDDVPTDVRVDRNDGTVALFTVLPCRTMRTLRNLLIAGAFGLPVLAVDNTDIAMLAQEGFAVEHVADANGAKDDAHGRFILSMPTDWATVVSDLERANG